MYIMDGPSIAKTKVVPEKQSSQICQNCRHFAWQGPEEIRGRLFTQKETF